MASAKCDRCGSVVSASCAVWSEAGTLCYGCLPPRPPSPPDPPPPQHAARDAEIERLKAELEAKDAEIAKRKKAARKVAAYASGKAHLSETLNACITDLLQNYDDLDAAYDALQIEIARDRHGRSLPLTEEQKQLLEKNNDE